MLPPCAVTGLKCAHRHVHHIRSMRVDVWLCSCMPDCSHRYFWVLLQGLLKAVGIFGGAIFVMRHFGDAFAA
jgi:hypothetical protein